MSVILNLKSNVKIGKLRQIMIQELAEATKDAANSVQNLTKQMIAKGPSRSGNRRSTGEKSSKKGEWPKGDTGTLMRSIMARHAGGALDAVVGSHLDYAEILESPRSDRRHISRAAEQLQPFITELANKAVANASRRAGA